MTTFGIRVLKVKPFEKTRFMDTTYFHAAESISTPSSDCHGWAWRAILPGPCRLAVLAGRARRCCSLSWPAMLSTTLSGRSCTLKPYVKAADLQDAPSTSIRSQRAISCADSMSPPTRSPHRMFGPLSSRFLSGHPRLRAGWRRGHADRGAFSRRPPAPMSWRAFASPNGQTTGAW